MGIRSKIKDYLFVSLRIAKYRLLSDCANVFGRPNYYHPLLAKGDGTIRFGNNVQIGVIASPNYYSHYAFIEARYSQSEVVIGDNTAINNAFSLTAFTRIEIGSNCLIGVNCTIIDTDAHEMDVQTRHSGIPKSAPILIGDNVFLGSNVTILKGVTIGKNSVIGNGSIVTKDIPENAIAAGNPARVIRNL